MEILLLGIYSFFVWLIFIKLKLLPWTTPWKVAVAIFPVVAIAALLLLLNIFAPTTSDVRVVNYVVPIVSQVRGRVIEVPVENNRPVKKGDVLFKIDPTPYQNEVNSLEAKLAADEAKVGADRQRLSEVQARLTDARSGERQLGEQLNQATDQVTALTASLDLARTRVKQNTELVAAGAGNRFDLEQAQTNVNELTAPDCGGARRRAASAGKALRPRQRRPRDGCGGQGTDRDGPGAGADVRGAGRHDARPARERPLGSVADNRPRAGQRDDGECHAPAGILRGRHAVQRGDDLHRRGVSDFRAVRPERAAPGRAGEPRRDHAGHLSGAGHQSPRGLGHLGPGPGTDRGLRRSAEDDVRSAARPLSGQARGRRTRSLRSFSPRAHAGPPPSTPNISRWCTSFAKCSCEWRRISTTSSSSTASAWVTEDDRHADPRSSSRSCTCLPARVSARRRTPLDHDDGVRAP